MNNFTKTAVTGLRLLFILLFSSIYHLSKAQESFRANLHVVATTGTSTLLDGNMTNYSATYSNGLDGMDAWKMTNFGENFGIYRENQTLVVERRQIINITDTTFFRMWNMQQTNYRLEMILKNLDHPGLVGYLEDKFLGTSTRLEMNDTTMVPFTVNSNSGSSDPFRFRLIYVTEFSGTLPIKFSGIRTWRKNDVTQVEWTVEEESSVVQYDVERSIDSRNYIKIASSIPANNAGGSESYIQADPISPSNQTFYRVKATLADGEILYSPVSRMAGLSVATEMNVYPNPITDKKFQLQINADMADRYDLYLVGSRGIMIPLKSIDIMPGANNVSVVLPANTRPGIYRLKAVGNGTSQVVTLHVY